ncbi:baculoviral IAP repeat-containing protein 3-like isoform X2 [Mya arenaria]|uniref:baculoviral IAP repeat-containing protein 3-like isoform X2 n=1 Tax=Mya arenaria TaxID=6604 RepID=UPI0022E02EC6|nr:baculoviral IAP repeat-containing protein 3-like isoform X2 [Mya arenaria]
MFNKNIFFQQTEKTKFLHGLLPLSTPSDVPGNATLAPICSETFASNQETPVSNQTAIPKSVYMGIPKHPKYSTIVSRIATFNESPEIIVSTSTLAEAGFFYAGIGDCTRCFSCGIALRHWTREDDPWTEHARFSLECDHVLNNKGQEFIDLVKLALDNTEEKDKCPSAQSSDMSARSQEAEIPKDDLESLMASDAAQSVRDMGYNDDIIRCAIREIITSKGTEQLNGMHIMEEVFRIEEGLVNNNTSTPSPYNENSNTGTQLEHQTGTSNQGMDSMDSKAASADFDQNTVGNRLKLRLKIKVSKKAPYVLHEERMLFALYFYYADIAISCFIRNCNHN